MEPARLLRAIGRAWDFRRVLDCDAVTTIGDLAIGKASATMM